MQRYTTQSPPPLPAFKLQRPGRATTPLLRCTAGLADLRAGRKRARGEHLLGDRFRVARALADGTFSRVALVDDAAFPRWRRRIVVKARGRRRRTGRGGAVGVEPSPRSTKICKLAATPPRRARASR